MLLKDVKDIEADIAWDKLRQLVKNEGEVRDYEEAWARMATTTYKENKGCYDYVSTSYYTK